MRCVLVLQAANIKTCTLEVGADVAQGALVQILIISQNFSLSPRLGCRSAFVVGFRSCSSVSDFYRQTRRGWGLKPQALEIFACIVPIVMELNRPFTQPLKQLLATGLDCNAVHYAVMGYFFDSVKLP